MDNGVWKSKKVFRDHSSPGVWVMLGQSFYLPELFFCSVKYRESSSDILVEMKKENIAEVP